MPINTSESGNKTEYMMVSEDWLFTFGDNRTTYNQGEVFRKSENLPIIVATWAINTQGEIVYDNPSGDEIPEQVTNLIRLNAYQS